MPRKVASTNAEPRSGKCSCNVAWLVVAWILGALGIWSLVGGFATQFASSAPTAVNYTVLGWYFVGLLLVGLAKMSKWKSCGGCGMHWKH
jgi:hypothetical protein